jgi:dolichol-phosphate mannosyltransferase
VALPAYNEAQALPSLLQRFVDAVPAWSEPTRVIVVDDGSSDGTGQVARDFPADGFDVEVVAHEHNRGLHAALDTGLRAALSHAGPDDLIATMDADDTHPPDLLSTMIRSLDAGADVVIASRFRAGAEWHGLSWDRVLFSHGVSLLFRALYPVSGLRDYTCGYRVYRARLLQAARDRWGQGLITETSFACMLELLLRVTRLQPRLEEVPLRLYYDRKPGPSKMQVALTIRRTLVLLARARLGRLD